jgi:hypothetical protein
MRWIGRLSYSLYLWHWPLVIYWEKLGPVARIPMVIGMPIASLVLAQLTFVAIETPARVGSWLRSARRGQLTALVLAAVTSIAAVASLEDSHVRLRDPRYAYIIQARDTQTKLHHELCHLDYYEVEPKGDRCVYGKPNADTTVVLMGDSHAAQWFAAIEPVVTERGWRIVPMTKSACPALSMTVRIPSAQQAYVACDRWRETVLERIAAIKPALIVLASADWYEVVDTTRAPNGARVAGRFDPPTPAVWQRGLQTTLDRLPRSSAILLLADSPRPRFDVPTCLFDHVDDVQRCSFRRDSSLVDGLRRAEADVARADGRVKYLDLSDQICGGAVCPVARDGMAMFSDADHLSVRYAATLAPLVRAAVDSMFVKH